MATTSPDNIFYPTNASGVTPLETTFSTLAGSVQTALNTVKTTTNALDTRLDTLEPKVARLPHAMAAGSVSSTSITAGGAVNTAVTFPAGRFSVAPIVQVTLLDGVRDLTAYAASVSATGFTLVRGSMSIVSRSAAATWVAVQMGSGSASG